MEWQQHYNVPKSKWAKLSADLQQQLAAAAEVVKRLKEEAKSSRDFSSVVLFCKNPQSAEDVASLVSLIQDSLPGQFVGGVGSRRTDKADSDSDSDSDSKRRGRKASLFVLTDSEGKSLTMTRAQIADTMTAEFAARFASDPLKYGVAERKKKDGTIRPAGPRQSSAGTIDDDVARLGWAIRPATEEEVAAQESSEEESSE